MEAVEEAIERRRQQQPEYEHFFKEDRLEGFFVKNLENVQGDERDTIIISVGYGRDQQGQMTMNFGPVNKLGGERRLNVAVTRAREKTILVSSIKASDIDLNASTSEGLMALRGYLDYAENGPSSLKLTKPKALELESPIEEDVAMVIQRMGYNVVPKVGWSGCPIDIGVADPANPDCYLLGIEFDGPTYLSINSARDRDRLRDEVLKQLGWSIHRIWSPSWVARRESEIRRLADALEKAHKFMLEQQAPIADLSQQEKSDGSSQEVDVQKVQFAGIEKIGVPYRVHWLKARVTPQISTPIYKQSWTARGNEFHFQENRRQQSQLLEELVNEEGPIHFNYAVQRIAAVWGIKRAGPRVVQTMREALKLSLQNRRVVVKGNFLWPTGLQDVPVRVPVEGVPESRRIAEYIPAEEIEKAIMLIAKYALGINLQSLIVETARVFGFDHTGERIREKIYEVYKRLLWERKLVCVNNIVTIP
jgi:hypothetical protein